MGDNLIQCPKCSFENDESAIECNKCGVTLSLVLKKPIKSGGQKPDIPHAVGRDAGSLNLSVCPKCGQDVLPSAAECIKCGIIFAKYFEFQERVQKEELEKADADAIQAEPKTPDAAEIEKAQALKKEQDIKDREEKEKALRKKQAQKAKEDAEKAEILKKEREEKEDKVKAQTIKQKQEERHVEDTQKANALAEEKQTIEQLEREIASLKSDAASLKMDTETLKKAEQEALKINEAAQKQIESLNQETNALRREAEALKNEKNALEEAEAKRIRAQEAEQKSAQDQAEALRKEREDKQKRTESILKTLVPQSNFEALLKKYESQEIGINYDDPAEIKRAQLAKVNADHFSVLVMENELLYSYPFGNILSIVEAADGVPVDVSGETVKYPIVVRVLHLMVKKKWSFI